MHYINIKLEYNFPKSSERKIILAESHKFFLFSFVIVSIVIRVYYVKLLKIENQSTESIWDERVTLILTYVYLPIFNPPRHKK